MKFTVTSINFAPDAAGIAVYSTDFPIFLVECGDNVTMVTGFSYYPQWKKRPEDKGRLFAREEHRGVQVFRGYLYVPQMASAFRRMIHEATFCLFAGVNLIRAGRPDAIVVFTPPFLLGIMGLAASKLWRCPFVINVQDLPVDAALSMGMIRKSKFSSLMLAIEGWIYRRASLVVTISESMMGNILSKGVQPERSMLVPNWIDVSKHSALASRGNFLGKHPQAKGKFVVAYAGNLGVKQGLDLLLDLAYQLKDDSRFYFFIIGDGADKTRLQDIATNRALQNVAFLPFMGPVDYKNMLVDVNVVFVAQRSGAGNNFLPSKLLGLMAQQKGLLVATDADSELALAIHRGKFGLVSKYGDIDELKQNLEVLAARPDLLRELGENGLRAVQEYDRQPILSDWRKRIIALKHR